MLIIGIILFLASIFVIVFVAQMLFFGGVALIAAITNKFAQKKDPELWAEALGPEGKKKQN